MVRITTVASIVAILFFVAPAAEATTTSCATVAACLMGVNSISGAGVAGKSSSGFGISGISNSSHGVNGTSASSFGVVGITAANATSTQNARTGVLGQDTSTNKNTYNSGVAGTSPYGVGVTGKGGAYGGYFTATHGVGIRASGADIDGVTTTVTGSADGIDVTPSGGLYYDRGNTSHAAIRLFANENAYSIGDNFLVGSRCLEDPSHPTPTCGDVVSIDANGNAIFQGNVTQAGTPLLRTRSATGADIASFGARTAAPSLEDVGKAQLRNGADYIALDRTFASAIDRTVPYMVFITPEGDSNGLYSTRQTPDGFIVRENRGGRSSLTFDYRIVAKPLDSKSMHLPLMAEFPQLAKHDAAPERLGEHEK